MADIPFAVHHLVVIESFNSNFAYMVPSFAFSPIALLEASAAAVASYFVHSLDSFMAFTCRFHFTNGKYFTYSISPN